MSITRPFRGSGGVCWGKLWGLHGGWECHIEAALRDVGASRGGYHLPEKYPSMGGGVGSLLLCIKKKRIYIYSTMKDGNVQGGNIKNLQLRQLIFPFQPHLQHEKFLLAKSEH